MSTISEFGTFSLADFGSSLFGTPSLHGDEQADLASSASDLLPSEALNELEAEYAAARVGDRPDGAAPASQLSRIHARRFLLSLSEADQPSTVYFNRDGEAMLEWRPRPGVASSAIITGDGTIRFASSRFGTRTSGTHFLTGELPREALDVIRRGARA